MGEVVYNDSLGVIAGGNGSGHAAAAFEDEAPHWLWLDPMLHDPAGTVIYLLILIGMTLLGTIGNILIIGATAMVKSLRTPGNLLIVNMATSDLLVSALTNPFAIVGTVHGKPWFEDGRWHLCIFLGSMCLLSCACSLLTILAIAFNRYVALLHHTIYPIIFTWRNSILICLAVWLVSFGLIIPLHVGWGGHRYDEKGQMCIFDRKASFSFNVVLVCVIVMMPVICIAFFYVRIFLHVRKKKQAIRRIMVQERSESQTKNEKKAERTMNEENKLARTLFIIFMGFFICWIPFAIVCLFDFDDQWPREVYLFTFTVDHFSGSGLNFILYGVTNRNFRRGYARVISAALGRKVKVFAIAGGASTRLDAMSTAFTTKA